jgi:hypothetical protein
MTQVVNMMKEVVWVGRPKFDEAGATGNDGMHTGIFAVLALLVATFVFVGLDPVIVVLELLLAIPGSGALLEDFSSKPLAEIFTGGNRSSCCESCCTEDEEVGEGYHDV